MYRVLANFAGYQLKLDCWVFQIPGWNQATRWPYFVSNSIPLSYLFCWDDLSDEEEGPALSHELGERSVWGGVGARSSEFQRGTPDDPQRAAVGARLLGQWTQLTIIRSRCFTLRRWRNCVGKLLLISAARHPTLSLRDCLRKSLFCCSKSGKSTGWVVKT